jgi:hypothetical protein
MLAWASGKNNCMNSSTGCRNHLVLRSSLPFAQN